MVQNVNNEQVRVEDVIQAERRPFVPEPPILDVPTPLLSDVQRAHFLLAVNAVRLGIAKIEVAVTYEVQVGEPEDLRKPDVDFVSVPGMSPKMHIGAMTTATFNKEPTRDFYIRVCDILRSTGLKRGWTSMRSTGLTSFKILTLSPGPILTGNGPLGAATPPPMFEMFQSVYTMLTGQVPNAGRT